jgi:uncharacterized protein YndB with AHSA1/START domain
MTSLATKNTIDGRPVLRFERRLSHAPEKVWRVITEPSELKHWFPAEIETDGGLAAGAAVRFVMDESGVDVTTGEVLECDPPKVLVLRWDTDVLRFEIVADGNGSRLYFSHTLGGGGTWGDEKFAAQHAAGWDSCLDALDARLDGREPPADRWFERNELYVEEFGLAEGAIADGGKILRFERVLVQPADAVWSVLSGDGSITVGSPPSSALINPVVAAGKVTAVEAERWIEYAWLQDGRSAGHVGWELSGLPFGCRLELTQVLPAGDTAGAARFLAGWQVHLELLVAWLHDVHRPWPDDRVDELTTMYAARIAK